MGYYTLFVPYLSVSVKELLGIYHLISRTKSWVRREEQTPHMQSSPNTPTPPSTLLTLPLQMMTTSLKGNKSICTLRNSTPVLFNPSVC